MKVLSLFSGIGAFEKALENLDIDFELDHYCEIDEQASCSYSSIHNVDEDLNLKDVTSIDYSKLGNIDLITYGFPCQDISLAGKQQGLFDKDGNVTRSGLFFNALEVIEKTKPKFAIFENVKNLTSKKFAKEFEIILSSLDEVGYNTYYKVLNAKDYGTPQNRERVFGISIRKDIDTGFEFPSPVQLEIRFEDYCSPCNEDTSMDDKWLERISKWKSHQNPLDKVMGTNSICATITTRIAISDGGGINASTKLYSTKISEDMNLRENFKNMDIHYLNTLTCWQLMEFDKKDYELAKISLHEKFSPTSNQLRGFLYKQAGNSIVVSVIEAIFESLAIQYPSDFVQRWGEDL